MSILNFLLEIIDSGVTDNKTSESNTPVNASTEMITLNKVAFIFIVSLLIVCFATMLYIAIKYRNLKNKIENNNIEKGE